MGAVVAEYATAFNCMIAKAILIGYLLVGLLYWLHVAWRAIRFRGLPSLDRYRPAGRTSWPRLTVIAPACNEADKIEPAMTTLLEEGYPNLEVILVDDRSSDGTGEIIDRMASRDNRVKAIHVTELPAGWLGKVHAMERGVQASSGQFILFTDADVHFRPGVLSKAVDYCLERGIDHLAALPTVWPAGLIVNTMESAFLRQFLTIMLPPMRVNDGCKGAYFGVGAFNLVRREALEKSPGLEWLRLETADDAGIGLLMSRSGAKSTVVAALDGLGLHWYRNFSEAVRGSEKAFASIGNCRFWRTALLGFPGMIIELTAVAGLAAVCAAPLSLAGILGTAVLCSFAFSVISLARWAHAKIVPSLLTPLVAPLGMLMTIRAAWLGWRRGGAAWRGVIYPSAMLRQGRRIRLW